MTARTRSGLMAGPARIDDRGTLRRCWPPLPAPGADPGADSPPCVGCRRPLVRVAVAAHRLADPNRGGALVDVPAYAYWRHLPARRRVAIIGSGPAR